SRPHARTSSSPCRRQALGTARQRCRRYCPRALCDGSRQAGRHPPSLREEIAEDAANCPGDCARAHEECEMTKLSDLKKRWMKDAEFRTAYEEADVEYRVVEALIEARSRADLSQTELAKRIGTTQSAIARLESGQVS